jgi:hypothetical protein
MPGSRYKLTAAIREKIVSYIRAGGFPHVAAEAAGLPPEVFKSWMQQGEHPKGRPHYRAFARAVHKAASEARLGAETKACQDKPLDWLKSGPGKENEDKPGWTNPLRAGHAAGARKVDPAVVWSEVLDLFGRCAEQLAPYPEARAALADWLDRLDRAAEK